MTCPTHVLPLDTPTYRGKLECKACVEEAQKRLKQYMERKR